MFPMAVVVIAVVVTVGEGRNQAGYNWKPSPGSSYPELLGKAKTALADSPVAEGLNPVSLLYATETEKEPVLASILLGSKLHSLAVVDSKRNIHIVVIADTNDVGGVKLLFVPVHFKSNSPDEKPYVEKIKTLVKAGKEKEAKKEIATLFEKK